MRSLNAMIIEIARTRVTDKQVVDYVGNTTAKMGKAVHDGRTCSQGSVKTRLFSESPLRSHDGTAGHSGEKRCRN